MLKGESLMRWQCIIGLAVAAHLSSSGILLARVSGSCANCHTMHNSQAGTPMAYTVDLAGTVTMQATPNSALLSTDCIGCHQGTNNGANLTPFVLDTNAEPTYGDTGTTGNSLAGGNFYWLSSDDRHGHNVLGISNSDAKLVFTPPGANGGAAMAGQITCAGTNGCHGDAAVASQTLAVHGSHHGNDATIWKDGSSIVNSYRFLDGVKGFGAADYEYQPTVADHNIYFGVDRSNELDTAAGSVSALCARCHGDFHNGSGNLSDGVVGNSVWLRHPIDYDMSHAVSSSEYGTYNTDKSYSVVSPVATSVVSTTPDQNVLSAGVDDAIVMCLSCHRAHGTPNDAILRWNYKGWPGPGGYNGCAVCHTTKD